MRTIRTLDLTGRIFDRWTVIRKCDQRGSGGVVLWLCRCECGQKRSVISATLVSGRSKSCGCLKNERARTHGKARSPIYGVWRGMMNRCYNPKSAMFHNYGARGIAVCDRWRTFENFLFDMGEAPEGMSLDRIDNEGHYGPQNCRWSTQKQQIRNKRNTARILYEGEMVSLAEICEQKGLKLRRVRQRLAAGMTVEKALQAGKFNRWET